VLSAYAPILRRDDMLSSLASAAACRRAACLLLTPRMFPLPPRRHRSRRRRYAAAPRAPVPPRVTLPRHADMPRLFCAFTRQRYASGAAAAAATQFAAATDASATADYVTPCSISAWPAASAHCHHCRRAYVLQPLRSIYGFAVSIIDAAATPPSR